MFRMGRANADGLDFRFGDHRTDIGVGGDAVLLRKGLRFFRLPPADGHELGFRQAAQCRRVQMSDFAAADQAGP